MLPSRHKYRDKQTIKNPHQLHLTQKLQIRHQNYLMPKQRILIICIQDKSIATLK